MPSSNPQPVEAFGDLRVKLTWVTIFRTVATTLLLPQICDAVKIPVIGAGGFHDGRGLVAVASKTGSVKLSSGGGDVLLAAGEQGQVSGAGQPQKSVRKAILLSVVWPDRTQQDTRKTTVRGRADVGSEIALTAVLMVSK